MPVAAVEIWHNPGCGNSRGALALIRAAGLQPVVVDYLRDPPDAERLRRAIADAGLSVREAVRAKEPDYAAQGLDDPAQDDARLIAAMVATPRLINRPFVFTPRGVRLCRPPETVLELL